MKGFSLSATASRTAQPPIQWVPGNPSLGVKRPGREADHSPPSSAGVNNASICMYPTVIPSLPLPPSAEETNLQPHRGLWSQHNFILLVFLAVQSIPSYWSRSVDCTLLSLYPTRAPTDGAEVARMARPVLPQKCTRTFCALCRSATLSLSMFLCPTNNV
jgi:hypothetical protein